MMNSPLETLRVPSHMQSKQSSLASEEVTSSPDFPALSPSYPQHHGASSPSSTSEVDIEEDSLRTSMLPYSKDQLSQSSRNRWWQWTPSRRTIFILLILA